MRIVNPVNNNGYIKPKTSRQILPKNGCKLTLKSHINRICPNYSPSLSISFK